jgi:hypothetical protein
MDFFVSPHARFDVLERCRAGPELVSGFWFLAKSPHVLRHFRVRRHNQHNVVHDYRVPRHVVMEAGPDDSNRTWK